MAKRYHNSSAMEQRKHKGFKIKTAEQYADREETKKMMARDGHLIAEDPNAVAMLPTYVKQVYWPKADYSHMGHINDLFEGSQEQMSEDAHQARKAFVPNKY